MNVLGQENAGQSVDPNSWKAIWSGPGSTFSKVTAVLAACGLGYGFIKALPFLITAASNTIVFAAELGVLALILILFTNKRFWKCISVGWRIVTKRILGKFVKIDPITILENSIEKLREQLDNVERNVTSVGKTLEDMYNSKKRYENEFEACKKRRDAIQRMLKETTLKPDKVDELKSKYALECNKIVRQEKKIVNQNARIEVTERYFKLMKKFREVARFKVADSEDALKCQKDEFKTAKSQLSAIASIKAVMKGQADGLEYDMALEYVNDTINDATAQMKEFLDGSNDIILNYNLDTYTNLEKVEDIVKKYENYGFDAFKSNDGTSASYDEYAVNVPFAEEKPAQIENSHIDRISKNDLPISQMELEKTSSSQRRYFN